MYHKVISKAALAVVLSVSTAFSSFAASLPSPDFAPGTAARNIGNGEITAPKLATGAAATNLGAPIGTSGATLPLLNGTNTWSGINVFPATSVGAIVATPSKFAGIDPTGATSSVAGLRAIIPALNAVGGGEVIIPTGTYKIDATIDNSSSTFALASNIRIRFAPGAKFVATSALSTSMWKIFGATDATYSVELDYPQFDASGGTCALGCQGGEGLTTLELQGLARAVVFQPDLYGGVTYNNNNATSPYNWNSNNGITTTKVVDAQILGGRIRGFPNAGVYTVGDVVANSPPSYNTMVIGTRFEHNNVGVQCKFSLDTCDVRNSVFDYNHVALGTYNAGTSNVEPAARRATFNGNTISHTQAEAIHCDGQTIMKANANLVLDIGYNEVNTLTNAGTQFFHANGCVNFDISGNRFGMKDWANSGFIAGLSNNATLDTAYTASGSFLANVVSGLSYAFYEGASVGPTRVSGLDFQVPGAVACNMTNAQSTCSLINAFSAATPNTTTPSCGAGRYGTTVRAYDLNAVTYGAAVAGSGTGSRLITCTSSGWVVGG